MHRWRSSIIKISLGIWLILLTLSMSGQGVPFPCDGKFFITSAASDESQTVILSAFPEEIGPTLGWDTIAQVSNKLGPLGFSILDNHLYAMDTATFDILKIDATGFVTVLGSIASKIDTSLEYKAGCVTAPGIKFTIVGRNPGTGTDERLYNVRLDVPGLQVGNLALATQGTIQINDIAYDPHFGVLYGFDAVNRRLVQIGGGLVAGFSFQSADPGIAMSGLFFDQQGNLYGYGKGTGSNGRDNTLFSISKQTGAVTPLRTVLRSVRSDACSCPYEIILDRSFFPSNPLPCDTIRLSYKLTNHSGFIYRDVILKDLIPQGLQVIETVYKPVYATVQSSGPDSIIVSYSDLDLRTDSLVFKVVVDPNIPVSGFQQAFLDRFPFGLGQRILSTSDENSELSTSGLGVEVQGDSIACLGESIPLTANSPSQSPQLTYTWSDGITGASRPANASGTYVVTVSNGCQSAVDSLTVTFPDDPLSISLPDQEEINEGNGFLINLTTNGRAPFVFSWTAPEEARLSCTNCASPIASPTENVTAIVTVTDAFGCTATDSIRLIVDKIRDVLAPNVFTPNQDGFHETFFLTGEANAIVARLDVFDRWGRQMFHAENIPLNDAVSGWQGNMGQRQAPEGVYFWSAELQYADETSEQLQGNVTLFR